MPEETYIFDDGLCTGDSLCGNEYAEEGQVSQVPPLTGSSIPPRRALVDSDHVRKNEEDEAVTSAYVPLRLRGETR